MEDEAMFENGRDDFEDEDEDENWEDVTEEDEDASDGVDSETLEPYDDESSVYSSGSGGSDDSGNMFGGNFMNMIGLLEQESRRQQEEDRRVAIAEAFPKLCEALRQNDPRAKHVGIEPLTDFPSGYGIELGRALQGNVHVEFMHLELSALLPETQQHATVNDLAPLLQYIQAAPALRVLSLRIMSPDAIVDIRLGRLFLQAAWTNPHIKELNLGTGVVPLALDALPDLLQRTKSITSLGLFLGGPYSELDYPNRLQQTLASAQNDTLETLNIYPGSDDAVVVDAALVGMASSSYAGRLQEVRFLQAPYYPHVTLSDAHGLGPSWLGHPTRCGIRMLNFGGCTFNERNMQCLLDGLRCNHSIFQLSLTSCDLDHDAAILFRQFWQSPSMRLASPYFPYLQTQLVITGRARSMTVNPDIVDGMECGEWIASLLVQPPPSPLPSSPQTADASSDGSAAPTASPTSAGSTLELLVLDIDYLNDFFKAFARQASDIRLPRLGLGEIFPNEWKAIDTYLPDLVHLRELNISLRHQRISAKEMVKVFRRNGSLHKYNVLNEKEHVVGLTPQRQRLMQAFHARNANVPQMLSRPSCGGVESDNEHRNDIPEAAMSVTTVSSHCTTAALEDAAPGKTTTEPQSTTAAPRTLPALFPPLYQSMNASPRMAPHSVITGLLALGESVSAMPRTMIAACREFGA